MARTENAVELGWDPSWEMVTMSLIKLWQGLTGGCGKVSREVVARSHDLATWGRPEVSSPGV
jgi:hypothetical protein